jgi:rhodanese-related sulfurtransferase
MNRLARKLTKALTGTTLAGMVRSQPPEAPEITAPELRRELERAGDAMQLVDVREPEEWTAGHLPDSVLIPMGELGGRRDELDRSRPVITVCRSGRRSLYSAEELLAAGFPDVRSLEGGVIAWVEAGGQLER